MQALRRQGFAQAGFVQQDFAQADCMKPLPVL